MPPAPYGGAPLRLLAIHGHGAPRWLIPEADSASAPLWPAVAVSVHLANVVVGRSAANRLELAKHLPHVESIELQSCHEVDWRALGWREPEPPAVSVYIGTPGATWKSILHLVNRLSGSCEAIVKAPLAPQARDAILSEADTLRRLAKEQLVGVPSILSLDKSEIDQQFVSEAQGAASF